MGDPTSNRATLRNKFELEKRHRSYADFHSKVVKSLPKMEASPSNFSQKQKGMEMEEIVKHMKHLPSYLERGKPIQDRALSFGVMDWGRLEKWEYRHHKQGLVRSNKCSPSSSHSSSLFSTDGSSPQSSRGQSCSPARPKVHRVTLQSHLKASPKEDFTPHIKLFSGNFDKFQYFKDPPSQSKSLRDMGSCHTTPSLCLKGKLKIQDESVNELRNGQDPSCRTCNDDHPEKHENVFFLARNAPGSTQTNGNNTPDPCTFLSEAINSKNPQVELNAARNQSCPSRNKTPERKRSSGSSENSDLKASNTAVSKPRSISPLRRFSFSFSMSSKSVAPTSATQRPEFPPVSQNSTKDSNRAHSSPLRRLLDPIFPSKARQFAEICHEDSRTKAKAKVDLRNSKEIRVDDVSSSRKQALFQTAVKNDRLLFTFAVENNKDVLAATVTSLSSSGKDDKNWLYTFFTVHEMKKKNVSWLSQGSKSKDNGYVPNVTAQMKVSNPSSSHCDTREFVLFSVNRNVQPEEELEAIVVKFSRKANREDTQESFSTMVILPGGSHGVPSKGEPSPLTDRWRSGGVCDCGGWDVGCRLRTLTNQVQSSGSRSDKVHMTAGRFELFFQREVWNKRPIFSLSPLKEGIFSVEYNSSLSPLQAFSICISVVECRKASQHTELRTTHVHEEVPLTYTSIPHNKRNTTGKVTSS